MKPENEIGSGSIVARLDTMGATASTLCAVHCALMPMVVTSLPFIGLSILADEATENFGLFLSASLGVSSLSLGYRKHRSRQALATLVLGLVFLALGRVVEGRAYEPIGIPLIVAGGLTIVGSHVMNRYLCRNCQASLPTCEQTIGNAPSPFQAGPKPGDLP
jgi:hypothetical protein